MLYDWVFKAVFSNEICSKKATIYKFQHNFVIDGISERYLPSNADCQWEGR